MSSAQPQTTVPNPLSMCAPKGQAFKSERTWQIAQISIETDKVAEKQTDKLTDRQIGRHTGEREANNRAGARQGHALPSRKRCILCALRLMH